MFDPTSRYYLLANTQYTDPDGHIVAYKKRRFLPQGEWLPLFKEVAVDAGERLDTLTMRTLGDPLQFWQVCDANNVMNPFDLVTETGRKVRIPIPEFQES